MVHPLSKYLSYVITRIILLQLQRTNSVVFISFYWCFQTPASPMSPILMPALLFLLLPPLLILTVNLRGWRTVQVGWPSAAWPWAEGSQSGGGGLSPGPWRGARRTCPSLLQETCRRRWWHRLTTRRRTGLEEGWRASLAEEPGAREYGRRSRRRGGRKQTCYDFDDGAAQAVRVGVEGRWEELEQT